MTRFITILTLSTIALIVVACSSGAASSTTPTSNPSPSFSLVPISTAEQAAARVVEVAPHLAGIGPKDPDLIGGCCFWEATPTADGFDVVFEVGSGDCQSGCIDRHRWTYHVTRDGAVTLISESGPPVPSGVPGSGGGNTGGILPGGTGIQGRVIAGPTCPVVTLNDPSCDDRPIVGAIVLILDVQGTEIARLVTDAAGAYSVTLPSGSYSIEPQPVDGVMRAAEAVSVTVGKSFVTVDLQYDTGIR
jgi:hypothetical protein